MVAAQQPGQAGGQSEATAGQPRRHGGELEADGAHHQGHRDHRHGHQSGAQGERRAHGPCGGAEDGEAHHPTGVEGQMGPELLRTGQVRAVLGEPRGNSKDQSADERHAGGQPGGEAEHEHHQQAAGAGGRPSGP